MAGKSIGVLSLKGGVGKTSSVVALGAALSDLSKKVLLVDANFSAPNLGIHLNVVDPEITLHNVMDRSARIGDAIYEVGENFHILPCAIFEKKILNPLELRNKLRSVKKKYDVVLIDSSPAMNDETLAAMLASDEILIVTTPDYATLSTTLKAVKSAKSRGANVSGLILNKVYGKGFELSVEDIEETAGVPVLAVVPHDVKVVKSLSKFQPFVFSNPNSDASVEYKKLAGVLIGEEYKNKRLKDFFKFWKKFSPLKQDLNRAVYYARVFDN